MDGESIDWLLVDIVFVIFTIAVLFGFGADSQYASIDKNNIGGYIESLAFLIYGGAGLWRKRILFCSAARLLIGNPVPGKHAFNANDDIFKVWKDGIKQYCRIGIKVLVQFGFSLSIDDTDVHFPCMQIDSAIKVGTLIVKSHSLPPFSFSGLMFGESTASHCRIKGGNQVRYFPAENGPIKLLSGGRKILGRVIGTYCFGSLLRP